MKHDWEYKPFAEVAEVFNGNSINADYKRNHFQGIKTGLPFIATKDVSFDGIIDYNNGVKIPNYYDYKVAPSGSVFVCAEGGSAGRKVAFITQNVCFGNKLYCISPKDNILNGRYLFLFVQAEVFREQFKTLMTGLIGGVSTKKFKTIVIPIPSMSEQEEIVARLDSAFEKIDTLRRNAEKSLTTAQQLFQSSLTNLLTPQPHWQRKKFGEVCSYNKNQGRWSGLKYIGMEHIEAHTGILLDSSDSNTIESSSFKFQKGDLLYGRLRPYLQKVIIAPFEGCCSTEIFPIQSKLIIHCFLKYWFLTERVTNMMVKSCSGCRMPRGDMNLLKEEMILFPPLSEQTAIVAKLDSLSAKVKQLKDNYTRTVALCDEMKQALLKEVFE